MVFIWDFFFLDGTLLAGNLQCYALHIELTMNQQMNFIMSIWVCLLGLMRGPKMRTYHWSLLIEFVILTLWIPPLYAIINKAIVKRESSSLNVPNHIAAITLVLVVSNM